MKLSIIIPVYNVASSIDRCVESVASQDYPDMEIILIDDGSTDNSDESCDKWRHIDNRIIVVHKKNGGLSDARNTGLDIARGEIVTFVDSDDYIAPYTYSNVVKDMKPETDIIEYPIYKFYGSRQQTLLSFSHHTYTCGKDYWLTCQAYAHTYACNKIFRRHVFKDVRFPVGKVFEDVLTMERLIAHSCDLKQWQIETTPNGLYYYCANPNGITAQATGEQLHTLLSAHLGNPWLQDDDIYYLHVLNIQLDVFSQTSYPAELTDKHIRLTAALTWKQTVKAILANILGIKTLCKLYKKRQKIRRHH